MVNNRLLQSFFTVIAFWYVILMIPSGVSFIYLPPLMLYSVEIVMFGALGGVLLSMAIRVWKTGSAARLLSPTSQRGIVVSIGKLPAGKQQWPRANINGVLSDSFIAWLDEYKLRYPDHAGLMLAVAQTMASAPNLPASPIPGGHGGSTLSQHSENMLKVMLEMAPSWKYDGHKNKSGKVVFPPIDPQYRFDPSDPLIPLCAFAHDIGKIECYKLRDDGLVDEVKANHDDVGGRLLLAMPEYWKLPKKDREAITLCVSFYHHISRMPLWVDDRTRALTELMISADMETAKRENDTSREHIFSFMEEAGNDTSIPRLPDAVVSSMMDMANKFPFEPSLAPQAHPQATATRASENASPDSVSANADWAYNAFVDLLSEPGCINGNDKRSRIGFKYGEWVYVSDALLRKSMSERLDQPRIAELPGRGQMNFFTKALLEKLLSIGVLMNTWNGMTFTAKRAMFKMVAHGSGGTVVNDWPYTIVFKASLFPHIEALSDCRYAPEITGPGWGEDSAFNKAASKAQTDPVDESAAAIDVDADVADDDLPFPGPVDLVGTANAPRNTTADIAKEVHVQTADGDVADDDLPFPIKAVNPEDAANALRNMARDKNTETPFKIRKQDDVEWAYFPEAFVIERFAMTSCDPAPEGARWVKAKDGSMFFGVNLDNFERKK